MTTFAEFMAAFPEPQTATVEPYEGTAGFGDQYGAPVTVSPCYVQPASRLLRRPDGSEVTATAVMYAPPGTICPPRSRVTQPSGATSLAVSVEVWDDMGIGLPDHVEIALE